MRGLPLDSSGDPAVPRRHVLGGCATTLSAGLAGCLFAGTPDDCDPYGPPPNGFEVRTTGTIEATLAVEIIQDRLVTTTTVFEETFEVTSTSGEAAVRIGDVVEFAGRYIIRAELEADPEVEAKHLWTVAPDRCDAVRITVGDGRIQITEPGIVGVV